MATLIPAYGRDYKSAKAVKADWNANKDFECSSFDIGFGQKINKADADGSGLKNITIRYAKKTKFIIV